MPMMQSPSVHSTIIKYHQRNLNSGQKRREPLRWRFYLLGGGLSYTTDMKDVDTLSMSVMKSPMATGLRKRRQVVDIPRRWTLQCQTVAIRSYYNLLPRKFICWNRQYRCPCLDATNVISSPVATTATANTIVANYGATQSAIIL